MEILQEMSAKTNGDAVLRGSYCGGFYSLDCSVSLPEQLSAFEVQCDFTRYRLWHKRLGHLWRIGLHTLSRSNLGIEYEGVDNEPCIACIEGKQARKPFKALKYRKASSKLELIHTDVCGPMLVNSFKGNKYILTFIDEFTRMVFIYFISSKSEVKSKFCAFKATVERETGLKIKILRSDYGTEYVNKDLSDYFQKEGIKHQTSSIQSSTKRSV